MEKLWAPWRLEYIESADDIRECIFCQASTNPIEEHNSLLIHQGETAVVLLNKFPYAPGHLLIAPTRHCDTFGDLCAKESSEIHTLAAQGMASLSHISKPHGFNVGWNLGRSAGAGIEDHIHLHVVPRWTGDTNFMPVLADTRVMPEHLADSRAKLLAAWKDPKLSTLQDTET